MRNVSQGEQNKKKRCDGKGNKRSAIKNRGDVTETNVQRKREEREEKSKKTNNYV